MRKPIRSGFTLVELLVVVTIIVVLIALLMPALRKAQETMKATACLSNLRQISVAHSGYAYDFGGNYPLLEYGYKGIGTYDIGGGGSYFPPNNDLNVQYGMRITWDVIIQPYLNSWKVLECPNDTQSGQLTRYPLNYYSGAFRGNFYRSYGLAQDVDWWESGFESSNFAIEPRQSYFPLPALTVLAFDDVGSQISTPQAQFQQWQSGGDKNNFGVGIQWRHCDDSRANVSYLDGHAEAVYGHVFPGLYVSVPFFEGYYPNMFFGGQFYFTDNGNLIPSWSPESCSQCESSTSSGTWPGH